VDIASALIDGGADREILDGSIGTPLDNAIGYACWNVARLLVTRGVKIDKLWHAAALGLLNRVTELAEEETECAELSKAFWHASAGGQIWLLSTFLFRRADLNGVPDCAEGTPLDAAATSAGLPSSASDSVRPGREPQGGSPEGPTPPPASTAVASSR
jgi:uncharacterized protein